jgi:hypothetical protein
MCAKLASNQWDKQARQKCCVGTHPCNDALKDLEGVAQIRQTFINKSSERFYLNSDIVEFS